MSEDWPDCAVSDCPRKCCLALSSIYCFPHTQGSEHVKRWKIAARNADDGPIVTPLDNGGYMVTGGIIRWSDAGDINKW